MVLLSGRMRGSIPRFSGYVVFLASPSADAHDLLCISQAVKGAAASFGVVTEFVVRTQPEPQEVTQYTFNVK